MMNKLFAIPDLGKGMYNCSIYDIRHCHNRNKIVVYEVK